ncbi:hypothetical protein [Sphingobacterium kyonggiense]
MKTPNQLADEIIQTIQEAGLSYDEMLQVIHSVRKRLEQRQEELNTPHPQPKLF